MVNKYIDNNKKGLGFRVNIKYNVIICIVVIVFNILYYTLHSVITLKCVICPYIRIVNIVLLLSLMLYNVILINYWQLSIIFRFVYFRIFVCNLK